MTCYRRYTFTLETEKPDSESLAQKLTEHCSEPWWFRAPEVYQVSETQVELTFEVAARDQWWAHRRAMNLMGAVLWPVPVPTPVWETLPPHANRGRYRSR